MTSSPPPRLPEEYCDGGGSVGWIQYTHDTGTHCGLAWSCSKDVSRSRIVSSMSLFTIVRSNRCPWLLRRVSDSSARRCRLSSWHEIKQQWKYKIKKGNQHFHSLRVCSKRRWGWWCITYTSPLPPLRGLKRTAFDVSLAKLLQR